MTDETHVQHEDAPVEESGEGDVLAALAAERDEAIDRWKRTAAARSGFMSTAASTRSRV